MNIRIAFIAMLLAPEVLGAWKAGLASIKITPEERVPLAGYASRTNAFTGIEHDLYAKALVLEDDKGSSAVLITADICILPSTVSEPICREIAEKCGLKREQILINVSHTHSGPWVTLEPSTPEVAANLTNNIVQYTRTFQRKLVQVGVQAFSKRSPAKLSYGTGVAHFAMNRRQFTTNGVILGVNPRGITDRTVPVLRIDSSNDELRVIVFGYACHGTTLPSDALVVSGDYPAYAREELNKKFPNAELLFVAGLGGSANPYPRTGLLLAKAHGQELAQEVTRLVESKLKPISGSLRVSMATAELPLTTPSQPELEAAMQDRRKSYIRGAAKEMLERLGRGEALPKVHTAPVALWQLGSDLTFVGLSGEVVAEFTPLIERAIGPMNLWLAAYCNAVSGYIPTQQVLSEGGYECRGLYEGVGIYAPQAQDVLVETIRQLARRNGRGLPAD